MTGKGAGGGADAEGERTGRRHSCTLPSPHAMASRLQPGSQAMQLTAPPGIEGVLDGDWWCSRGCWEDGIEAGGAAGGVGKME